MIAKLRGLLDGFGADFAVIDVDGVGYLVSASSRTLSALGAIGEEVVLHTEMLVAEDFDPPGRLHHRRRARLVPAADLGPGRRRPRRARHPLGAVDRRGPPRGGERRQCDDRPRPGRRPQARPAHRPRAEGQGRQHRARPRRPGRADRRQRAGRASPRSPISASARPRRPPPSPRPRRRSARTRRSTCSSAPRSRRRRDERRGAACRTPCSPLRAGDHGRDRVRTDRAGDVPRGLPRATERDRLAAPEIDHALPLRLAIGRHVGRIARCPTCGKSPLVRDAAGRHRLSFGRWRRGRLWPE